MFKMENNKFNQISKSKWPMRIFGVIVFFGLIYMFFFFNSSSDKVSVSEDSVFETVVNYLNSITGGGVSFVNSRDIGNLYEVTISYQGQQIPVYVTKDGEYFISEIIPMNQQVQTTSQTQQQTQTQRINLDDSEIEGYAYLGDENAPVTIIEFTDFSCPFCQRHYQQTKPEIKSNYIDTGLVKYVFVDFVSVGTSTPHEAALCVRELADDEAFWKMFGLILDNQQEMRTNPNMLAQLAVAAGVDVDEFNECLDSGKYQAQVSQSTAFGRSLGITGTPGFLIGNQENGYVLVSGAQSYNVFQQTIERELNN